MPGCELIVYHCTGSSMAAGVEGERRIVDTIARVTGQQATSTAAALLAAFEALGARRLVFISPATVEASREESAFLREAGLTVVGEHAMGLVGGQAYSEPLPSAWLETARKASDPRADAYFLACTTTQAPEAIEDIEAAVGRPAVASNQATLWYCLRLLGLPDHVPGLGRLMQLDIKAAVPA